MRLLTAPRISNQDKCPYIEGNIERHEFFFADEIKSEEMGFLLSKGWRKFGHFLFRPRCDECSRCRPLRVVTKQFSPTKAQRRNLKKNAELFVKFSPLEYRNEHFEIYEKHSRLRFQDKQIEKEEDFIQTFYSKTDTQYMSEIFEGDKLVAFGILDKGDNSLSSVYFVFDTDYSHLGLGTFGALKEIEYAKDQGLSYYYLGYWIKENKSMAYKASFRPHQIYDWKSKLWVDQSKS